MPEGSVPRRSRNPTGAGSRIGGTALIFIAAFLAAVITFAIGDAAGGGETTVGIIAQLVLAVGIVVFSVAMRAQLPAHERRAMTQAKCSWGTAIAVALGLAVGTRILVGIVAAIGEKIDPGLCEKYAEVATNDAPELWHKIAIAVALVVLAPVGEELLFRGILLRGVVRTMPFSPAAIVSGLVFGVVHVQYWTVWPLLVGVGLFGVAAGFAYRRFGYPTTVLAHALFNAIAAVFLFVDVGQTDAPNC